MTKEKILEILNKYEESLYVDAWDDIDGIHRGSYEKIADEIINTIDDEFNEMVNSIDVTGE